MNRALLLKAIGSIATVITAVFAANEVDKRTDRRASKRLLTGADTAKKAARENADDVRANSRKAYLKARGPLMIALVSIVLLTLAVAHAVGIFALVAGLLVALLGAAGIKISTNNPL